MTADSDRGKPVDRNHSGNSTAHVASTCPGCHTGAASAADRRARQARAGCRQDRLILSRAAVTGTRPKRNSQGSRQPAATRTAPDHQLQISQQRSARPRATDCPVGLDPHQRREVLPRQECLGVLGSRPKTFLSLHELAVLVELDRIPEPSHVDPHVSGLGCFSLTKPLLHQDA